MCYFDCPLLVLLVMAGRGVGVFGRDSCRAPAHDACPAVRCLRAPLHGVLLQVYKICQLLFVCVCVCLCASYDSFAVSRLLPAGLSALSLLCCWCTGVYVVCYATSGWGVALHCRAPLRQWCWHSKMGLYQAVRVCECVIVYV